MRRLLITPICLRNSFGYEQEYIKNIKESVKKTILDGSSKWSAKLDITVVEAQGLIGKDKSGMFSFLSSPLSSPGLVRTSL